MADLGIRRRIRRAVEDAVPWFDRAQEERDHQALAGELEASRMVRDRARQELMRGSFARATQRLGR